MDQATTIKRRAQGLIQRGALKDAMAEYEKLLKLESINPYAYVLIGDLAARMGSRSDALHRYHQGVEAYEALGLHRNAIAILKRLIRLEPGQVKNLRRIADVYSKEGLVAESIAHYLEYATRRIKDGSTPDAREALDAVCKFGVPNAEIAGRVTELLCSIGEHEKAARELVKLAADFESRGQGERARLLRIRAENIASEAGLGSLSELAAREPREGDARVGQETEAGPSSTSPRVETVSSHAIPAAESIGVFPGFERAGDIFTPVAAPPPGLPQMLSLTDEVPADTMSENAAVESTGEHSLSDDSPGDPSAEIEAGNQAAEYAGDGTTSEIEMPIIEMPLYEETANEETPSREDRSIQEERPVHHEAPPVAPRVIREVDEATASKMPLGLFGGEDAVVTAIGQTRHENPGAGDASMIGRAPGGSRNEAISEQVANIFDRFRAEVAPQLGVGDHATHYDLGITYMEMGVFTEAISEFRIALEGAGYRQRCLELLATCYSRLDRPDLAAAHWRAAIQEAGDGQGDVALRYELACALAAAGQVADAREELRRVLGRDPSFDAARVRLESLGS